MVTVPASASDSATACAVMLTPASAYTLAPTPAHIDASAAALLFAGMPRVSLNRRSDGPSQRLRSSHAARVGELRLNRYDAAITNTVVGNPGTNTPAIANTTESRPRAAHTGRPILVSPIFVMAVLLLLAWSQARTPTPSTRLGSRSVPSGRIIGTRRR